jgi:hypothetical protein
MCWLLLFGPQADQYFWRSGVVAFYGGLLDSHRGLFFRVVLFCRDIKRCHLSVLQIGKSAHAILDASPRVIHSSAASGYFVFDFNEEVNHALR